MFENNNTDSVVSDEESIGVPQSVAGECNARRGRGRPTYVRTGQRGRPKKVYRQTVNGINSEEDAANSDEFYECNEDISARLITEDPQILAEALKTQDASMWLKALEDEFLAHMRSKTWQIVERPSNRKVIGNKFVFRTKDENLKKARLVAKGYVQRPGEDFHEVSSPVVRSTSVRFFTALAADLDLQIHQMDVVTAYLNGDLDENVYMDAPDLLMRVLKKIQQGQPVGLKGMTKHSNEIQKTAEEWRASLQRSNTACLVKKALYGLRQSGLMWYHKLSLILNEIGLKPTIFDPCLYVRREGSDTMFVIIYVDDLLLASNNGNWIKTTKEKLSQNFDMKDMGNVNRCFGINFHQNLEKGEIFLSQRSYAESVLNRFRMSECNPSKTPIETNCNLTLPARKDEAEMAQDPFQSLIGALMYLAVSTRPDIAYAVNFMSQFNNNYTEQHWKAAKRILCYIKGTLQQGLLYKKTGEDLYLLRLCIYIRRIVYKLGSA